MNTDGSVNKDGSAAAGGVIRSTGGEVVAAYSSNLGRCSITRAEISGIVAGLEIAWDAGIRRLAIQTDSTCTVQILNSSDIGDHPHATLVMKFQELQQRAWRIELSHVFREANFLADAMANAGHALPFGLHQFDEHHPAVAYWNAYDRLRSSQPRLVLRNI
ncbi:Putative ribonuclease H protein At1g65750 [Linum grandiflorum]